MKYIGEKVRQWKIKIHFVGWSNQVMITYTTRGDLWILVTYENGGGVMSSPTIPVFCYIWVIYIKINKKIIRQCGWNLTSNHWNNRRIEKAKPKTYKRLYQFYLFIKQAITFFHNMLKIWIKIIEINPEIFLVPKKQGKVGSFMNITDWGICM